jgi:hypothetical protein
VSQEEDLSKFPAAHGLAVAVREALDEYAVGDALMLRRVLHVRSLVQEVDRELAALERYFTGSAQTPAGQ